MTPQPPLEKFKGEIFLHYKIERKTLEEVRKYIHDTHGVLFSQRQYYNKIVDWGFQKHYRKPLVRAVLREMDQREREGKNVEFILLGRPVDTQKIERHSRRERMDTSDDFDSLQAEEELPSDQLIARTPSPVLQGPQYLVIPEKIYYDIEGWIRSSFESGNWRFFHNERLVNCIPAPTLEKRRIMRFRNGVDVGCVAAWNGNYTRAGRHWKLAALEIEHLLKGAYYDIIPNILTKLNDLINWGRPEVAVSMMRHISQLCHAPNMTGHPIPHILKNLGGVNLEDLNCIEHEIRTLYYKLFDVYLGWWCYNSFVLWTDRAKQMLECDDQLDFDQCLPNLWSLEKTFGWANCRSLDILRLRMEILFRRRQYQQVINESQELYQRAVTKNNDRWQQCYFLIKALHYGGSAHYHLGNQESTKHSFEYALYLDDEFRKVDKSAVGQFDAERVFMLDILKLIPSSSVSSPPFVAAKI